MGGTAVLARVAIVAKLATGGQFTRRVSQEGPPTDTELVF